MLDKCIPTLLSHLFNVEVFEPDPLYKGDLPRDYNNHAKYMRYPTPTVYCASSNTFITGIYHMYTGPYAGFIVYLTYCVIV